MVFCVVMETIVLDDRLKAAFLKALEQFPSDSRAAKNAGVTLNQVRRWFDDDPDFNLQCSEIKERVTTEKLDSIEDKALEMAEEGSENMIKFVLPALRREKWNPALRIEAEVAGHRFFDFTGQELLTAEEEEEDPQQEEEPSANGETIDGEFKEIERGGNSESRPRLEGGEII